LHGIGTEIATFAAVERDLAAGLLAAADAFGADLLAMGAYSHSRLRQLFGGGMTRHVLQHGTLAVLMNR
jgi:nucleotide-binding universal stress UspA family protein